MSSVAAGWLEEHIRDVADFPKPGVLFKDITPLLADPDTLQRCVAALAEPFADLGINRVVGIEARGFIIAPPVALVLGAGFVPIRKQGKLPWAVHAETYDLEYGTDTLEVHQDGLAPTDRVLVVDDVLATGGTAAAGVRLVQALGATPVGFACVLELGFLGGRGKLGSTDVVSLLRYE